MARKKRVVLVVGNTAYGRRVAQGIIKFATVHGGWEFLYKSNASDQAVLQKAVAATRYWADGIVAHCISARFTKDIQNLGAPAVNVSSYFDTVFPPRVHSDEVQAGRMGAQHLLERGVKSFIYWGFNDAAYSRDRRKGFQEVLAQAGQSMTYMTAASSRGGMRRWMTAQEELGRQIAAMERPVGILCVNDMVAREVLWVCQRVNLKSPEDVAVLGIENDELACAICVPPLSSVELPAERIGHDAADLLNRMMEGEQPPDKPLLIPPISVITRASTDMVASGNAEVAEAIRFIRAHAHETIDVRDVLRAVPISRRALEIHFKRLLNRTPRQQIQFERIELVKKLLIQTDLPISQVAEKGGFSSPSLLWVVFQRFTGQGPREFRISHR